MAELRDVDYERYLTSVYPGTTWSLSQLAEATASSTYRATLTSGSAPYNSLIVKHAESSSTAKDPPGDDPIVCQTVEAEILRLWSKNGELYPRRKLLSPPWICPELIRHDKNVESVLGLSEPNEKASILLVADIGSLVSIVEFLEIHVDNPDSTFGQDKVEQLGATVGHTMAIIHDPATFAIVQALPGSANLLAHEVSSTHRPYWKNRFISQYLNYPIEGKLLSLRIGREVYEDRDMYPKCLALRSISPRSILLKHPTAEGEDPTPILADWKFAVLNGHDVNGDVAGFLAVLRCELIIAKHEAKSTFYNTLLHFTKAFCTSYRQRAGPRYQHIDLNWCYQMVSENGDTPEEREPPAAHLLRSTFIIHGVELMQLARNVYGTHACLEEMKELAVWYIKAAGDDIEDFVSSYNRRYLRQEPDLLLQSLFDEISLIDTANVHSK